MKDVNREIEDEIIKMFNVTTEIRAVLENILKNEEIDKVVSEDILFAYIEEVETILTYLKKMPTDNKSSSMDISKSNIQSDYKIQINKEDAIHRLTISECQEQQQKSQSPSKILNGHQNNFQIRLSNTQGQVGPEIEITQLVDLNHELSEENDILTKKLEEAQQYIKQLQNQSSHTSSARNIKQDKNRQLNNEAASLRQRLREAEEFIVKNNQEFIREIQKYNERLWKLEKDLNDTRNKLYIQADELQATNLLLNKLRQENFRLTLQIRQPYFQSPRSHDQVNKYSVKQ